MLPDFPKIKSDLHNLITLRLRHRVKTGDPVISMAHHISQHEGDKAILGTIEGKQKELDYKGFESIFRISKDEIKSLTIEDVIKKIDSVANEMTGHMAQTMFANIKEAAKEVGTEIEQKGKPFTFETFLEALDKIWIDFDEKTGKPHMPSLVMHPNLLARIKDKFPEWEKNEEYRKRFNEIMKRKYKEWYDRESNRKLVD